MSTLTLQQQFSTDFTALPNTFFDVYMPRANGEFVKVYLYIVRCLSNRDKSISVATLADTFNHTEADIMRALRYWNNEGLLEFVYNSDGSELVGLNLTYPTEHSGNIAGHGGENTAGSKSSAALSPEEESVIEATSQSNAMVKEPARTNLSAAQIRQLSAQDEITEMFYVAERYLNRLLNPKDREVLLYLYVDLQFTVDLIIYLVEYCVTNNHASIHYIQKVALDWHSNGVTSIQEAKDRTSSYNSSVISVMKAFGISGRSLGQSEKEFIDKWNSDYCFTDEMIVEACNRTIQKIHEPSFKYADSILKAWREKNIFTMAELENSDKEFASNKSARSSASGAKKTAYNGTRNYDFSELERTLIEN
ncbi:MAG: DnaD domain protein [Lachnospiraceae bacterium]